MKKKIVIVEDDLIIQELHRHYVEDLGHDVIACCTTGEEAIDFFREHHADLILMDVRLEDSLDGIDTVKKIQEIRAVPVLYVTGNTEDANFRRAIETNMKGFVTKPISPDELEKVIDSLKELTDSILFAENIQQSILPQRKDFHRIFNNCVFVNRPRNTITGDFSVISRLKNREDVIIGLGDCTGHGVPAALLSVLSHGIVSRGCRKTRNLPEILSDLGQNILRNLSRLGNEHSVPDGLDIVLLRIDTKKQEVVVSGIRMAFIHYRAEEKQAEYYSFRGQSIGAKVPSLDEIAEMRFRYQKGDFFYFFSDGVTDQFGGPFSKKLSRKGLLEYIHRVHQNAEPNKEIELDLSLRKWQGTHEQTDDMLLIGFDPSSMRD
jgi:sigma-B regulation protein RsbU (phosphoserine phosphatase)